MDYHLSCTDAQFRRRYRLSKATFLDLAAKVKGHWTTKIRSKYERKSYAKEGFTSKVRLAMTLRFLAGGSYIDVLDVWGCPVDAHMKLYRIVYQVVDIINVVVQLPGVPFDKPWTVSFSR